LALLIGIEHPAMGQENAKRREKATLKRGEVNGLVV